jgi:group I intron endonuclease
LDSTINLRDLIQAERKRSGIYCIVNTVNSKLYVGSSTDIARRINNHFTGLAKQVIQHSINKYGPSFFDVYILEYTEATREDL